jgi:hypothetical protein
MSVRLYSLDGTMPPEVVTQLEQLVTDSGDLADIADLATDLATITDPIVGEDTSAAPGNATHTGAVCGKGAIAIGAATCVLTVAGITTSSIVMLTSLDLDATATLLKVACTANTITVTANANATAATKFAWYLVGETRGITVQA